MTEHQAKQARKLNQAIKDFIKALPDTYTLDQAQADLERLKGAEMSEARKISAKLIAGLVKWQVERL